MKRRSTSADRQKELMRTAPVSHAGEDLARERSGFDLTNWNAAISLQVKVRDAIGYPVSMADALAVAEGAIEFADGDGALDHWKKEFENRDKRAIKEKEQERKRIAEQAGR